ncbi:MAG: family 16 glycosylhydrolase [Ornithinimicrobium sp.]
MQNPWPQAGLIDFMEYVGRELHRIFGTIHGPGYFGGGSDGAGSYGAGFYGDGSYGDDVVLDEPNAACEHEYAVEWKPGEIIWEFDGE